MYTKIKLFVCFIRHLSKFIFATAHAETSPVALNERIVELQFHPYKTHYLSRTKCSARFWTISLLRKSFIPKIS